MKDCIQFSYKNIIHDKIILFDTALLVQNNTMRVTLNEVLNNYGLISVLKSFLGMQGVSIPRISYGYSLQVQYNAMRAGYAQRSIK